ncbi:MAG TPA: hypothetical protein VGE27_08115 [Gemmatimonas sp.]|uniref:hypothetical protein n=1 Tax=Gemmatimonas sp. TaxID=1962908 RepID=UPI002ED87329
MGGLLLIAWTTSLVRDRNPLPFPDRDYHVFSAKSTPALIALEDLMQLHGHVPRFRVDSDDVERTIFSNGTIVNHPRQEMLAKLGAPSAALGFVVDDPEQAAREAVELFRRNGFTAELILDAEPGLPITFVTTDALSGSAIVFRKHVLQMGQKPPAWTPRNANSQRAP